MTANGYITFDSSGFTIAADNFISHVLVEHDDFADCVTGLARVDCSLYYSVGERIGNLASGKLTISKPTSFSGKFIQLQLYHCGSQVVILDAEISLKDFGLMLLHSPKYISLEDQKLNRTPIEATLYHLDKLGKELITKPFEFNTGCSSQIDPDFENLARSACIDQCPEGWEPNLYLKSRSTFFDKEGTVWGRTTIKKWE
jgi:hypothetical protein